MITRALALSLALSIRCLFASMVHSSGSVARSYGRGVPLRVLAKSMAKVRFAL